MHRQSDDFNNPMILICFRIAVVLRSVAINYLEHHHHNGSLLEFPDVQRFGSLISVFQRRLFMKLSFLEDPVAAGPLCSVICADVILVPANGPKGGEEKAD